MALQFIMSLTLDGLIKVMLHLRYLCLMTLLGFPIYEITLIFSPFCRSFLVCVLMQTIAFHSIYIYIVAALVLGKPFALIWLLPWKQARLSPSPYKINN